MSLARSLLGASATPEGNIRIFNGLTTLGVSTSMETYDRAANVWTTGPSAGVKRYGHATATDGDGNVYVLGGTSDGKAPLGSVEMYSPKTNAWTPIADLPTPRLGLGAAVGNDKKLYAIGGRGPDGLPSSLVEVYAPDSKTWSKAAAMPTPRFSHAVVKTVDGMLYAIGGRDAATVPTPYATVEIFDPAKNVWKSGPSMHSARYWFGATMGADGHIYVCGGIASFGFTDDAEVLDVQGAGWKDLPRMPEARAWNASAALPDGRIFVIGGAVSQSGSGTPPPNGTMFAYDPKANIWLQKTR